MRRKISHKIYSSAEKTVVKCLAVSAGLIFFLAISISCAKPQMIKSETDSRAVEEAETLYKSPLWTDRVSAIGLVTNVTSMRAEELIINATDDEYPRVRIEALGALSKFKTQNAFDAVRRSAEKETDKSIKWTAIKSLAEFRNPLAAPIFIHALSQDDWLIREEAIRGLLVIRDSETEKLSVDSILHSLSDPSENVRIATLSNLKIENPKIYAVLKIQISDEKNRSRFTYLEALLTALVNYKLDEGVRKIVLTLITHSDAEIRILALRCVKSSDEKPEIPAR